MSWILTGLSEPVLNEDRTSTYQAKFYDERLVEKAAAFTILPEEEILTKVGEFLSEQNKFQNIEPEDLLLISQLIDSISVLTNTIATNASVIAGFVQNCLPIFEQQQILFLQQQRKTLQLAALLQAKK